MTLMPLLLYAKDIMSTDMVTVFPETSCAEAAGIFSNHRITGAPVVNEKCELVGVISTTDLLNNTGVNAPYRKDSYFKQVLSEEMAEGTGLSPAILQEGTVADFMTLDVFTASPETPVSDLARTMYINRVHRVIITDTSGQKPVGIVTTYDLLKVLSEFSSGKELAGRF